MPVHPYRGQTGSPVDQAFPYRVASPKGQVEPASYPKGHLMEFVRPRPIPRCYPRWMWISGAMMNGLWWLACLLRR